MMINFLNEKKASSGMAVGAIVMGIIAVIAWIAGAAVMVQGMYDSAVGIIVTGGILGFIAAIFQLIVMRQWSLSLEVNKDNTKIVLDYLNMKAQDLEEKFDISLIRNKIESIDIKTWAFWLYLVFYILNFLIPIGIFGIIGLVFFAIYLQSIFTASKQLQEVKTTMYNVLSKVDMLVNLKLIKPRNIGLVILLSIVTLGIYALYLLVALTKEINAFIDQDTELRSRLVLQAAKES